MKILMYLVFILLLGSIYSCSTPQNNEAVEDPEKEDINIHEDNSKKLHVDGFFFAKRKEKGISAVDPPVFRRGDEVFMVLQNVGVFSRADDSLNHVELHMNIRNSDGELVEQKRNILGNRGKKDLKNNILNKPYVSYRTILTEHEGTYHFILTVVDRVSLDSCVIEADYFLE